LALPDSESLPLADLGQTEAVRLFVDRVHAAKPGFALNEENAPPVAAIVRRLDGLPLAIELAAARVRVLSPAALLARLDRRLPLLTGGAQDLPDRQRTLRGTIAWSYALLPPNEHVLFRCLSVFVGGWGLEAAEAVCEEVGGQSIDVLNGITTLVDHSLISEQAAADEVRFGMLETIREFGLEQLAESGEEQLVRDAHARHFLERVETYRYLIESPQRPTAQAHMRRDLDNIRSALVWAIQRQDATTAQGIAGGLGPFWMDHGLFQEGRDWIDKSLALPVAAVQVAQGAQYWGGHFALWQGDVDRAEALGRDDLARARSPAEKGDALLLLGSVAGAREDPQQATALVTAALELFRNVREPPAALAMEGVALYTLGEMARDRNDLPEAQRRFEESLAFFQTIDDPWGIPTALLRLADIALIEGDSTRALVLYAESLLLLWEQHDAFHAIWTLQGIGETLLIQGRTEEAVRLLGAADRLRGNIGHIVFTGERVRSDDMNDRLQTALGDERFAAAWDAGRALELDAAVAEALALAASSPQADPGETKSGGRPSRRGAPVVNPASENPSRRPPRSVLR
jgi:non-specific serine/threonine protein kinase